MKHKSSCFPLQYFHVRDNPVVRLHGFYDSTLIKSRVEDGQFYLMPFVLRFSYVYSFNYIIMFKVATTVILACFGNCLGAQ